MTTMIGDEEVPARVRLISDGRFQVGGVGEEIVVAFLELDGHVAGSQFHVAPQVFTALHAALGGLPPRSRRGLRRWVADRIPTDVDTVRDRQGREWFRLSPGEPKWSRLDYVGHWSEGQLVYEAGPVVEVPDVTYEVPDGQRTYVRTER